MPDLKRLITLEALQAALPSWLKSSSKPSYTADEISDTNTTNKFVTSDDKSTWNSKAAGDHVHGNITNAGALQSTDVDIANGDKLVVTDASKSNKVARTSTSFDGSTTTQALTKKGTFETFPLAAYGTCDTAADVAAKVVTLASNSKFTLVPGSIVAVLSTYTNTAQNPTLNVNGTGAKPIVYGTAVIETTNLSYATYANRQHLFIYDGTNYIYLAHNTDANTTYTNAGLGQGYGTCTTAASTAAKAVTLGSYALTAGGIVSVKFSYDVPASATMNINNKGAKAIYHRGAAITAGVIKAGDTATFIYSTYYHLISIDRDENTSAVTGVKGNSESSFRTGDVNITPSDIGAVALTGNTVTGDIQRKHTEIDASKANNNISATKYPTTYSIIDNSGRILVRNEAIVEPSGNISWYAYVRNYNTSGGQVAQKGIKYTVNKSGTGTWTVDDSDNFRTAIGAGTSSFSGSYNDLSNKPTIPSDYVKQAHYTSNKTSGSLNDLSEGRVYCSSNCTNLPVSANMMVETLVDNNGTYKTQRAEVISGSYAGHVFSRYYNGSWSSWIDLTLNAPIILATNGNISSASIDLSSILTGTYLFTVTNNESGTTRYGCSLYVLQKFDSGTIYVMKPVSEITNAKLSTYSFSGDTMSLSFDKSGYKTLRLICLYRQ